jgi:nitrogen PTS system EIIA component
MKLAGVFTSETVIPRLNSGTKPEAIAEMVDALRQAGFVAKNQVESLTTALLRREEMGSTGIGGGVGVPHVKHAALDEIRGVFGRSEEGIEFQALDGAPVDMVFLLVSPPDTVEPNLKALRKISAMASDADFRRFLRRAKTAAEIVDLMREADERIQV